MTHYSFEIFFDWTDDRCKLTILGCILPSSQRRHTLGTDSAGTWWSIHVRSGSGFCVQSELNGVDQNTFTKKILSRSITPNEKSNLFWSTVLSRTGVKMVHWVSSTHLKYRKLVLKRVSTNTAIASDRTFHQHQSTKEDATWVTANRIILYPLCRSVTDSTLNTQN